MQRPPITMQHSSRDFSPSMRSWDEPTNSTAGQISCPGLSLMRLCCSRPLSLSCGTLPCSRPLPPLHLRVPPLVFHRGAPLRVSSAPNLFVPASTHCACFALHFFRPHRRQPPFHTPIRFLSLSVNPSCGSDPGIFHFLNPSIFPTPYCSMRRSAPPFSSPALVIA
jgi:hypothetical protein